jgi:hypothetical protein
LNGTEKLLLTKSKPPLEAELDLVQADAAEPAAALDPAQHGHE